MSQPETNDGWQEQMELRLEGGGHLPGASEIVAIKHQVASCSATRRDNLALVQGEMEVYVYYRIFGSEHVRGQGAKVPWYVEVPIPDTEAGVDVGVRVVDVKHEHMFNTIDERFNHTMRIIFDIWTQSSPDAPQMKRSLSTPDDLPEMMLGQYDPFSNSRFSEQHNTRGRRSSATKDASDVENQIPAWAREAAEELMRVQQPTVRRSRPARRGNEQKPSHSPDHDTELGSAQGSYAQPGQLYEGPEPEWPTTTDFALLDALSTVADQPESESEVIDTSVLPTLPPNEKEEPPVTHFDEPTIDPSETMTESVHPSMNDQDSETLNEPPQPMAPEQDVTEPLVTVEAIAETEPVAVTETDDNCEMKKTLFEEATTVGNEEPVMSAISQPETESPPIPVVLVVEEKQTTSTSVSENQPQETAKSEPEKMSKDDTILVWKPFPNTKLT
jgi:hypothetical protein